VDAVVARVKMEFKTSLKCDDVFVSRLALRKEGLKYIFNQDLYRLPDEKISLKCETTLVCLVNGRLANSEDYDRAFSGAIEGCGSSAHGSDTPAPHSSENKQ
jgi:acyl-CoA thioester hydrolase